VGGERVEIPVAVDPGPEDAAPRRALAKVWARMQIAELADRAAWDGRGRLAREIRDLALEHGLVSDYTSFVAVDSSRVTEGRYGTSVNVAVPVPDGARYDTTLGR
jgi:Ca-activated chloride channel family protein